MTSSNVSNMLIQVKGINVEMNDAKGVSNKDAGLFEKTLQNVADSTSSKQSLQTDIKNTSTKNTLETSKTKIDNGVDGKVKSLDKTNEIDEEEIVNKVNEATDKVTEVIEEELDVTKEDIEKALENLGLTMIDLLNPQSLAQVVAELTSENDSIALVMSDEFKTILDSVTEVTDRLFKELNVNFDQLKEISLNQNQMDSTEVSNLVDTTDFSENNLPIDQDASFSREQFSKGVEVVPEVGEEVNVEESDLVGEESIKSVYTSKEDSDTVEVSEEIETVENQKEIKPDSKPQNQQEDNKNNDFTQTKLPKVEIKPDSEPVIRSEGMIFSEVRVEAEFIPENQVVALPTGETVSTEEIVSQLVEQARVLNDAETTTMEMTLNPEGLGKIFMEVTQKGDEITAKIFTENDAVKQALEVQMANLRVEMNQNSTKVTSIEVSVGTHEFERNLDEQARENQGDRQESNQSQKRNARINLNNLDELSGLMSDEDLLIAQMMKDNGNTLDFQA